MTTPQEPIQPGKNWTPGQGPYPSTSTGFTAAVEREASQVGPAPSRTSNQDPPIFSGIEQREPSEKDFQRGIDRYEPRVITRPASEWVMDYYRWDGTRRSQFNGALAKLGYDVTKLDDAKKASIWTEYVKQAAAYFPTGRNMDPWDIMGMDLLQQEAARQAELEAQKLKGPETKTTTTSETRLSTELDAKAVLYQASKTLLGRAPTEAETASFWSNLNQQESANPVITETTTVRGPQTEEGREGDIVSQNQVTSGGLSADAKQMLVMEEAKKNPEYGAYQAATTFKSALTDLVFGKGY